MKGVDSTQVDTCCYEYCLPLKRKRSLSCTILEGEVRKALD